MKDWLIFCITIESVALLVTLFLLFKSNGSMKKNKNKFDLRNVKFFIEPVDDADYILTINYGLNVLHTRRFTDADIVSDRNLPFKEFVKWCEEESSGSIN